MNLDLIASLQTDFGRFYDENFKLRNKEVYNKEIDSFNKRLEEAGISSKLSPKEIELKLQQIYEELMKAPAKTTLNAAESAQLQEEARIRNEQIAATRENQTKLVEDFIKQNEERIAKAKSLQDKLKDKVVYAKVVIPESEKLSQDEQQKLEVLVNKANNDTPVAGKVLTHKQELIEDFTLEIEKKLEPLLKDLPEKEREIVARTYAVEIVEKIASPEVVVEERVQTVILDNIAKPKQEAVTKTLQKDDELITLAKNGAVLIATKQKDNFSTIETITTSLVGPKIASKILGSQNYQVTFSDVQVQGETTHIVRFGELNQQNIHELTQENGVLTTLQQHGQQFGYDKINSVFTNYAGTFLKGKIESLPAGSVIKKAYKDPIVQGIFARYGMAEPIVWQAVGQSRFVGLVMKIAPDTAGPVLGLVSKVTGKQLVTPIATKVAGQAIAKGAVATSLSATLSATFGSFAPIVGHAIGAVVGWIGGELLSKLKTWWTKNKESIKPFLVGGLAVGGLVFGGPAVGGIVLLGGLAVTGGLAAFATGAFGVLGFIGRSVGIAIATPVIITLLIIPPLVALILLVINNSAYVVPPSFESGEGGFTPVECQGEAPEKPTATNIKYSSDGKYAFPTAPFEMPGYACYHWDGNKAADIFSPQNKPPMVAYESGTISSVVLNDSLGGKYIMLKGASGRHYYYAHLCHVFVKSGEAVKVGDVIATMDETGSGRVQHLHYAINEPPLTDTFIGGDGNVCPQKDFEEKFGFGVCNTNNACVNP